MVNEQEKVKSRAGSVRGKVLSVDREICIACGACEETAPKYFKLKGDEGKSSVIKKNVDDKDIEMIKGVIAECPTQAISYK